MSTKTIVVRIQWLVCLSALLCLLAVGLLPASTHAQSSLANVSGEVWFDANGNGKREVYEPLLVEHPVTLVSRGDALPGVLAVRVVTDENGRFSFRNIEFGDYTISAGTGAVQDINVSMERSSTAVSLGVLGQRIFLPVLQK